MFPVTFGEHPNRACIVLLIANLELSISEMNTPSTGMPHIFKAKKSLLKPLQSLSMLVRRSRLTPSSGAPPEIFPCFTPRPCSSALPSRSFQRSSPQDFPRFTPRPCSSGAPVSLLPQSSAQAISMRHTPSTVVRRSRLAPPKLYFHASHPIHARPALRSRSNGGPPKRFKVPLSSGTPALLLPAELPPSTLVRHCGLAELPPSYFHASHPIHARLALPFRSFQRSSPQAISTLCTFPCLSGASIFLLAREGRTCDPTMP